MYSGQSFKKMVVESSEVDEDQENGCLVKPSRQSSSSELLLFFNSQSGSAGRVELGLRSKAECQPSPMFLFRFLLESLRERELSQLTGEQRD